jgi:hypothetical protein
MRHLIAIFFILSASSCSNDFDVVIPAKPTTFVYCVLNTPDSVHYIRINKSFITLDNVYDYVKRSDSLYYPDLNLLIELTDNNSRIVSIKPGKIIYEPKDFGLFTQNPNILYAFKLNLKDYLNAKLRLIIPQNADTITAETAIVADTGKFLLPGKWSSTKSMSFFGGCYNLRWETGGGAFHSMSYTFHYRDILADETISRSFEYMFQYDFGPNAEREFCLRLEDLLYTINSRIPDRPEVEVRMFDSIDFHIDTAEKFLYDYANIFRENPSEFALINFTNIKNGSGIFSSRSSIHLTGMRLDVQALDALINSVTTKHLRFIRYE